MDLSISMNAMDEKNETVIAAVFLPSVDNRVMFTFEQLDMKGNRLAEFTMHLPLRMSACATMMAEAFNAHMRGGAATVDAQTAPSEPHRPGKARRFIPTVGGVDLDGNIRIDDIDGHAQFVTQGEVYIAPDTVPVAKKYGWHCVPDGNLFRASRGYHEAAVDPAALSDVGRRIKETQRVATGRIKPIPASGIRFPTGGAGDMNEAMDLAARLAVDGDGPRDPA